MVGQYAVNRGFAGELRATARDRGLAHAHLRGCVNHIPIALGYVKPLARDRLVDREIRGHELAEAV